MKIIYLSTFLILFSCTSKEKGATAFKSVEAPEKTDSQTEKVKDPTRTDVIQEVVKDPSDTVAEEIKDFVPADEEFKDKLKEQDFEHTYEFRTSLNKKEVWIVANTGNTAHGVRILVDKERGYPTTEWQNVEKIAGQGTRTYVSEIGLLMGQTRKGIYRLSDDIPNTSEELYLIPDIEPTASRVCVSSFLVDGVPHIGAVYRNKKGERAFLKFPIDLTKPKKVDISKIKTQTYGASDNIYEGYGCFVDQQRGIFWAGPYRGTRAPLIWGVDVKTLEKVEPSKTPNYNHTNDKFTLNFQNNGSYSIGGDGFGNIISLTGKYTSTYDPVLDLMYISGDGGLHVSEGECFRTKNKCEKYAFFKDFGFGPLSALNDGSIVGVVRGATSQVFRIQPKDITDITKGLIYTKIADVPGNSYIYSDFTGGTLYAATVDRNINLKEIPQFKLGVPISNLKIKWTAESGIHEDWKGLKMQIRCYLSTDNKIPEYTSITLQKAEENTPIEKCTGKFDTIDIHVEGDGSNIFSRSKSITLLGTQKEEGT